MATFGEILKREREAKGMSQETLAKELGVTQQAVANWEAGTSHPAARRRQRLVEIFGDALARIRYGFVPTEDMPADTIGFVVTQSDAPHQTDARPAVEPEGQPVRPRPGGWATAGIRDLRERRVAILNELRHALPERLRDAVGRKKSFGQVERDYEYVSNGVVARIVEVPNGSIQLVMRLSVPIIRLAMAVDPPMAEPTSTCILFVLSTESPTVVKRRMEGLILDAHVLNVTIEVVPTIKEIAQAIEGLEALYAQQVRDFEEWMKAIQADEDDYEDAKRYSALTPDEFEALAKQPPGDIPKTKDDDLL